MSREYQHLIDGKPSVPYTDPQQPPHYPNNTPGYSQPPYGQPAPYGQPPYGQPAPYGQPPYSPPGPYGQPYSQPSTPYGQPPFNPQPTTSDYQSPPGYSEPNDFHTGEKFPLAPKYQDVWCTFLFLFHIAGMIILFIFGLGKYRKDDRETVVGPNDSKDLKVIGYICLGGFFLSCFQSVFWSYLAKSNPTGLIKFSIFGNILIFAGYAVLGFLTKNYALGIVCIIFIILFVVVFYSIRSRIPFAASVLRHVTDLTSRYPGTSVISWIGLVITFAWITFCFFTFFVTSALARGAFIGTTFFVLFSFYWFLQVTKNVVHVSVSGTFATDYFFYGSPAGMPKNPTLGAAKRAMTYSFGSICFGSMIVAFLETLRALLRSFANRNNDNFILVLVACFLECILSYIEALIKYFNVYAFTHVAIYGKSFCEAAKDTWNMFQNHGFEAIANDNLIGTVINMACIFSGFLCACYGGVLGYVFLRDEWVLTAVLCFLIGFVVVMIPMSIIQSGVCTTFVCFVEQPEVMRQNNPELHRTFTETYNLGI